MLRESWSGLLSAVVRNLPAAFRRLIPAARTVAPDTASRLDEAAARKELNAILAQRNEQLDAALENMLQGLAMFDAEQRLIVCNRRYSEMYRLTADQVRPGTTVREILQHRLANGNYVINDNASFLDSWTSSFGDVSTRVQELADGRIISVSRRSMASDGRLVTHEDITERQKLSTRLEQQHQLLSEQEEKLRTRNLQLDAAMNNMAQGLAMFDSEHRVIIANARYAEIYRLPAELTKPGTSLRAILSRRLANGEFAGATLEDLHRFFVNRLGNRELGQYATALPDGRCISVSLRRMGNDWLVSTHQDVTDLQKAEKTAMEARALAERAASDAQVAHTHLLEALDVVPEGIVLFDSDDRFIMWNRRYVEMYGHGTIAIGKSFAEVLREGLARGQYPDAAGREEAWLAERLARHANKHNSHEQRLSGGRWVRVEERRTADGGAIGVRIDITELKRREEELNAQKRQFEMALTSITHGLCVFDADERLVMCNEPYLRMYGLSRDRVYPGIKVQEILRQRTANGIYSGGSPDDYLRERVAIMAAGEPTVNVHHLSDGRIVEVNHHPIPGGGSVATHNDITERRRIEARLEHLARHDPLTGLPNRVLLREYLEQALNRTHVSAEAVAVLWLDLDHFKEVNDTFGHPTGDALLKEVAARLCASLQEKDLVARLGGDEFAIVQSIATPEDAAMLATTILSSISKPYDLDGHQVEIGISIGIAVSPHDGHDADQFLKSADLALYGAKTDGRGSYRFFEPVMNTLMHARRELEKDLRKALRNGEFEIEYQPVVDLGKDRVGGCEALLRWNHPERGRISPATFIPVAEATGLIVQIGEWVLRAACAEAASWPHDVRIAVNLSAIQLKSRGLMQAVMGALAASGLAPQRLELEITESVLLNDSEATRAILRQLHDLGVRIALDDFGTGYSSLSYLRSFPFDKIKIDRCFIADLSNDSHHARAILRAVVQLGNSLGMTTTAEGVETDEQLSIVREEGCTEVQGYIFSASKRAAELRRSYFADHAQQPGPSRVPDNVPDLAIFPEPEDRQPETAPAPHAAIAGS
jgi:diguanylate cyclase (GGDEF)-like protein/PAS domain S-box-containing protein